MRELDFLPAWYPAFSRRKRLVALQAYMALIVIAGLSLWMLLVTRNIHSAEGAECAVSDAVNLTRNQLVLRDQLQRQEAQLERQNKVLDKLGLHVEMARMIRAIDDAMPTEMSLLNLDMNVEEKADATNRQVLGPGATAEPKIERRLIVHLHGVAPTDVDLARFMTKLTSVPFFEQITPPTYKEKSDNGHLMREFEITFSLDLSGPAGN